MIGNDVLKQLKKRESDQMTLKLKDGDKTIELQTNNIHNLVKRFATKMYKSQGINPETGL